MKWVWSAQKKSAVNGVAGRSSREMPVSAADITKRKAAHTIVANNRKRWSDGQVRSDQVTTHH